jgi:hypothetical protein
MKGDIHKGVCGFMETARSPAASLCLNPWVAAVLCNFYKLKLKIKNIIKKIYK